MTLPIGSGFYSGAIPGKITAKQNETNKPHGLLEQTAATDKKPEYVKSSQAGFELAQKLQSTRSETNNYQQTIYDQPSAKVSKAISTYTEFANLERRAEVQNLIGVDIYA